MKRLVKNSLCPTDLGVIMSYQCQCACKHCPYHCGPYSRNIHGTAIDKAPNK